MLNNGGNKMAFCSNCGNELTAQQDVCLNCGRYVNSNRSFTNNVKKANIGWGILGFFLPFIGFILYLVWKDSDPENSLIAGKGALWAIIISFGLGFLAALIS